MHNTHKIIVLIGFSIIFMMGMFPPWMYTDENNVGHPMGYGPIWKPPVEKHQNTAELFGFKLQLDTQSQTANTVDLLRLATQIAILSAVMGAGLFFIKGKDRQPASA